MRSFVKLGSTTILRLVIYLIGIAVLALCLYILPVAISAGTVGGLGYGPIILGMYLSALPFFAALYQGLKLLGYIDKNEAFSLLSVKALKKIKYCASIICGLYVAGMPYIFYLADSDDAPGLAAIGFIVIFASFVIAAFAAVLEKLLRSAIEIKTENELTV